MLWGITFAIIHADSSMSKYNELIHHLVVCLFDTGKNLWLPIVLFEDKRMGYQYKNCLKDNTVCVSNKPSTNHKTITKGLGQTLCLPVVSPFLPV